MNVDVAFLFFYLLRNTMSYSWIWIWCPYLFWQLSFYNLWLHLILDVHSHQLYSDKYYCLLFCLSLNLFLYLFLTKTLPTAKTEFHVKMGILPSLFLHCLVNSVGKRHN